MHKALNILQMILLLCLVAGQKNLFAQDLVFEDGCDFGTIYEKDGKAVREFHFRNARRDTVVICDATTACRCITGEPSFSKVAPGEVGTVKVIFDPAYRSGPFDYPVVLWYMDRKLHQRVRVKGDVVPMSHPIEEDHPYCLGAGLFTSHKVLPFGTVAPGETKTIFFRYGNGTDKEMSLVFEVVGCCAGCIEMQKTFTLAPDQRGKLYVSLTMPKSHSGSHINYIWPVVNGQRLETPILVKMKTL